MEKLRIRTTKHLCSLLRTHRKELDRICRNPERCYRSGPRRIHGKIRDIDEPVGRLKEIQGNLQSILQRLPLPEAVHGGRKGHDIISNARPHRGQEIVVKADLKDFFPSIESIRVYKMFLKGQDCTPVVANYLTLLTTVRGRVPQGAPTSNIVAALVTKSMTERLQRIAVRYGGRYTHYVDDINISGTRRVRHVLRELRGVVHDEGYVLNEKKTKVMPRTAPQVVTGVAVHGGIDAPPGMILEIRRRIDAFAAPPEMDVVTGKELRSLNGSINHISRLNLGAGKSLRQRLRRKVAALGIQGIES